MSQYIKIKFTDKQGREIIREIDRRDYRHLITCIAEEARWRDIGPLYIERDGDWEELDYYNDI